MAGNAANLIEASYGIFLSHIASTKKVGVARACVPRGASVLWARTSA